MSERQKDTISIVIADKSPLVQSGLAAIFGKDERFTLVAAVERLAFDIGIIGWDMPYMSGSQVIEALAERDGPPRIVVYTGNAAPGILRRVMELGGAALLPQGRAARASGGNGGGGLGRPHGVSLHVPEPAGLRSPWRA